MHYSLKWGAASQIKFPETSDNFSGRKGAMDEWMFGLLVGWIDGGMDRRMAGLENKHQENRVFHRIFRKTVS